MNGVSRSGRPRVNPETMQSGGSGKTTSVAKLGQYFINQDKTVILGACDTYRAAAVEQLSIWSERIGVRIVKHDQGADPGAVAYDACEAAAARQADILLIDTAGRLHTQDHLMRELGKIQKVVERKIPGAPHEVLLVLDAIGSTARGWSTSTDRAEKRGRGSYLASLGGVVASSGLGWGLMGPTGMSPRMTGAPMSSYSPLSGMKTISSASP